jgi:hypothetical protein
MTHGGGRADEGRNLAGALAKRPHLAAQLVSLERPLGDQDQTVGLERLLDVVVCAALDGRHGRFDVAMAGNHHDRQVGVVALDRIEQGEPVHAAALQPDVEEDERRPALGDLAQRAVGVGGGAGAMPLVRQDAGNQIADVGFVVNYENV